MSQIASVLLYYFVAAIVRFLQPNYTFDENVNTAFVNIEIDGNLEINATVR